MVAALVLVSGCGGPDVAGPGERTTTGPAAAGPRQTPRDPVRVEGEVGPERAEAYRQLTVQAVRRTEQLWGPGSVPVPVRLVLPADADAFGEVTGLDSAADVPAAVVGRGDGARLVVHPGAWERLTPEGRLSVLTHEVTHLVMQGDGPVPWWLGEGLAEYTAHRGGGSTVRELAGTALDLVRAGRVPQDWPERPPGGPGDRWGSYAMAWLACHHLAETYSERGLLDLYRAVAGGEPVGEAAVRVLGVSEDEALATWRAWLVEVAGD